MNLGFNVLSCKSSKFSLLHHTYGTYSVVGKGACFSIKVGIISQPLMISAISNPLSSHVSHHQLKET